MYTTLFAKISYSRCIKIEIHLYPPLPKQQQQKNPSFQNIKDQEKCFHGRIYSSWVCSCCLFCHPEFRSSAAERSPQHAPALGKFPLFHPKIPAGLGRAGGANARGNWGWGFGTCRAPSSPHIPHPQGPGQAGGNSRIPQKLLPAEAPGQVWGCPTSPTSSSGVGREGWEQSIPDPRHSQQELTPGGFWGAPPALLLPPPFSTGLGLSTSGRLVALQGPPCHPGCHPALGERGWQSPAERRMHRERPQNKVTKQKQWPWPCDNSEIII